MATRFRRAFHLLGAATCFINLVAPSSAKADKVSNFNQDITVCSSLDSLTVMREMPKSAVPNDCRVLKKGTWIGVVLINLISTHKAEQIGIPLTNGELLRVWAPADQLYGYYD